MAEYLSKFTYGEKFDCLPEKMELDARGELRLERTRVDMVPAGLKGVTFVFMDKKPRYIAPDFKGIVLYYNSRKFLGIGDMTKEEVEIAKARYTADRENVEKPRYIQEEDGSLSLCSLPSDMHILSKPYEGGYYLDLTRTSISEKQNLGGFKNIILYPKKPVQQELPLIFPKRVAHHRHPQMVHQKPRIYG